MTLKRATGMKELARRAGVSESTVSRALADNSAVALQTRERIQALARETGYRVNPFASSLRRKRSHTVSVVIALDHDARQQISDPFFMTMLGGITDALFERGYDLLLSRADRRAREWPLDMLASGRSDGLILIGQSYHHDVLNRAAAEGAPMVVWGAAMPDQTYVTVGSDNESGGRQAAAHLLASGRTRLAFLGDTALPEIAARRRGFDRALAEVGLDPGSAVSAPVHFDPVEAFGEVSAMIGRGLDVDGVVATSDVMAASVIGALGEAGRRVPDDIAVTGFDDVPLAAYTSPPLTTVRQDMAGGARALVDLLVRQLGGEAVSPVQLPTRLVVRRSAPAARRARGR